MSIRLLIADDHPVVRAGLEFLVSNSGIEVVAQAQNGNEAQSLAQQYHPDVMVLDVRMPDADGMTCLTNLHAAQPHLPVIMFSESSNPTYVARALAMGAAGFLSKASTPNHIVESIKKVAAGESLWTGEEMRRVKGSLSATRLDTMLDVPLTKRESEVLKQLSLGLSNKEIALALSISYETVKEHVQHVLRKLGVSDRTQAAVWAVRNGLA